MSRHRASRTAAGTTSRGPARCRLAAAPTPRAPKLTSRLSRAAALEGDPDARHKAEEAERERWLERFAALLRDSGTPSAEWALRSSQPDLALRRLAGGRRVKTLRGRVRAWEVYSQWLTASYGARFPTAVEHISDYLEARIAEPCSRSVLRDIRGMLIFMERAAGIPEEDSLHRSPTFLSIFADMEVQVTSSVPTGAGPRKAPRPALMMLARFEELVLNDSLDVYWRMYFW